MKVMNLLIMVSLLTTITPMAYGLTSNGGRGGGDPCEQRIQSITEDLAKWVSNGGAGLLDLPQSISKKDYTDRMLNQITTAKVSCVSEGDAGYPVQIEDVSKVCIFDSSTQDSRITCDLKKFLSLTETKQYVLIHHEYAGLAGVEIPNGSTSDYTVSNQISAILLDQKKKGLNVLPGYTAELVIPPGLSLPKDAQWVLRNYFHNYCRYSMAGVDALLESVEVKQVTNKNVIGYTNDIREIKVSLNMIFGSDDTMYEKDQRVLLNNTSGSYQIQDVDGICPKVIQYN